MQLRWLGTGNKQRWGMQRRLQSWVAVGLLWVAFGTPVTAEEKPFNQFVLTRWGVQEGFPQVSALQIIQDNQGYIWASTQNGITRFDGVRFKVYGVDQYPNLLSNHVESLYYSNDGKLWAASAKGLVYLQDEQFHVVADSAELGIVSQLYESSSGQFYAATSDGLKIWHDGQFSLHNHKNEPLYALTEFSGQLVAGTDGGLLFEDGQIVQLPAADLRVQKLSAWKDILWIGTNQGLLRWDGSAFSWPLQETNLADQAVESLFVDSSNRLWVGTYLALVRFIEPSTFDATDEEVFGFKPWIVSMMEDHEGNLWLGSKTHSLMRVWDGWTRRYSAASGLTDTFVWSVEPGLKDDLWIGTNSGLFSLRDKQVTRILRGDDLPDPAVYTMYQDPKGMLWIGTKSGAALWQDGQLVTPDEFQTLNGQQINSIIAFDNQIWFGGSNGLYTYDGETLRQAADFPTVSAKRVRILIPDGPLLWVGSEDGLRTLQAGQLEQPAMPKLLTSAFITSLAKLEDGRLLVGTLANGLFVGRGGQWTKVSEQQGLPRGGIFYMASPDGDFLWVGAEAGAFRIAMSSLPEPESPTASRLQVENLVSNNGLVGSQPARCCNGAGTAKGAYRNGSFWFPTLDGLLELQPDRIQITDTAPPVVIESVQVADQVFDPGGEALIIGTETRDLTIDYTALTYRNPKHVQFRYRLLGYNDEWIEAGTRRTAYYTSLPPGDYVFEVAASNSSRNWNPNPNQLPIVVEARFYESAWFLPTLALLLLLLIGFGYQWRMRSLRRVQRSLERKVSSRTEELRELNSRLLSANQELQEVSQRDALTGTFNRRYVMHALARDVDGTGLLAERSPSMLLGLVDIDHFKRVNDEHGHSAGDDVLIQFAKLLKKLTRAGDDVIRWGGEEFLLILNNVPQGEMATIANRICEGVASNVFKLESAELIGMTCSVGLARYPVYSGQTGLTEWEYAVELADYALYAVKRGGRNGWARLLGAAHPSNALPAVHTQETIADQIQSGDIITEVSRPAIDSALRYPDRFLSAENG